MGTELKIRKPLKMRGCDFFCKKAVKKVDFGGYSFSEFSPRYIQNVKSAVLSGICAFPAVQVTVIMIIPLIFP